MVIKINYTSSDVYVSTSVSPVYVVVNYSAVNNGSGSVWGSITGTLSNQTDLQNALNAKVPYTGATQAVNLGAYDLTVNLLTIGKGNNALVNNTALGHSTLLTATTGNFNTAVGYESLRNTTTGQYNTAVGQSSLFSNNTGGQNTALGLNALLSNTSGSSNVAVGLDSLQHNTTGSSNTAIGYNAGSHITGGSTPNTTATNSVFIGRDSKANADGQTNQIVIGQNAVGNGSNTATFGNSATTANYFTGSINGGSFVKSGGTSAQILAADGSVLTAGTNITISSGTISASGGVTGSGVANQLTYWNGTGSVTGSAGLTYVDSTGSLGLTKNHNAATSLQITNTITGTAAAAQITFITNLGTSASIGKFSTTYTAYKILSGGSLNFFNTLGGDVNFLNDFGTGGFRWAAGASLTAQMTLFSTGNLALNSVVDAGYKLDVNGTARVSGATTLKGTTNNDTTVILRVEQQNGNGRFSVNASGQTIIGGDNGQSTETFVTIGRGFNPTSGTTTHTTIGVFPVINQTGGANGITRGLYVNPTLTAAADWRSIEWSNNSGWGLYGAGTADSYLGGRLTIGETTVGNNVLNVRTNLTGALGSAIRVGSLATSSNTVLSAGFMSQLGTDAVAFNFPSLIHFYARQGTIGAGSSITNQIGFLVEDNLTTGTNTFAFYGSIANGANRWNLYMAGTADNYLRGKLLINTTTVGTFNLDVNGTARVSGSVTIANGHLTIDGNAGYVIGLCGSTSAPRLSATTSATTLNGSGNTILVLDAANNRSYFTGFNTRITAGSRKNFYDVTANDFSGNNNLNDFTTAFSGSLGTNTFNHIALTPTGSPTSGTPNYRGIYINTIQTGFGFIRAIESVVGGAYFNTTSVAASAILQADSTTQGFLPPRMTTTQKNAISSPAAGLQVYDTTLNQMSYYNGTTWVNF